MIEPKKHSGETHSCCNTRLQKEGGQAHCCYCVPHEGCEFTAPHTVTPVSDRFTRDGLNNFIQESAGRNDKILEKYLNGTPTPPPTEVCCDNGNFGDGHECLKAPPTEGTIQRLRELVGNDIVLGAHVESAVLMLLAEQKARMVEEVEGMKEECTECENREKHDTPRNMLIDDIIKALSK